MSQNSSGQGVAGAERRNFMSNTPDSALAALSPTQAGFIVSMRSIPSEIEGSALREYVAEMFPPSHLFGKEICDMPSVWIELRNFLDTRGANLTQHSTRRVIMTLAHGLYTEAEDREAAVQMATQILANGRRVRKELSSTESQAGSDSSPREVRGKTEHISEERVAHNIAMRLKDPQQKFTGDLGECWMEYVDEYQQIARDYHLSPSQKLQYLHNILSKDAQRYYLDSVQAYATTFQQAVEMINREYNSPVRQTRVKNFLNSLRVSDFVASGTETSAALAKVYKLILQLSRQVPASHRGDAHRIEFLRRAVIGYSWSHEPLSRVPTHELSFQQLYGELEAALQLEKEAKLVSLYDKASQIAREKPDTVVNVDYAGQGRYGRRNQAIQGHGSRNPLSISGCFNCDDPSHMLKDCPKPRNVAKAAARKLEYLQKKKSANAVHLVLAYLCQQMDDFSDSSSDDSEDDLNIFHQLMNSEIDILYAARIAEGEESSMKQSSLAEDMSAMLVDINFAAGTSEKFEGACVDSGAQLTVIGSKQAHLYCESMNEKFETKEAKLTFRFGAARHPSLGKMTIRMPVSETHFTEIIANVVDVDVPFLLGLDIMTKLKVILDFDEDTARSKSDHWSLPLTRKLGHAYIEWTPCILYTESELRRIHRHFYHPQTDKLFAVMKRADPKSVSSKIYTDLQKIQSTCEVCQHEASAPHRFRVSLPNEDCVFNRVVSLDLMNISGLTVLHAVDRDTKFGAACFLKEESTAATWEAFLRIWVAPYVGYPEYIATDQGPQFTSAEWHSLLVAAGIRSRVSGVESHNALGSGERYHAYLRRIYSKIRTDSPSISADDALTLAVKAVNDTAGPSGLVPTLLVFGVMPRIPVHPKELPAQAERMQSMRKARDEMKRIVAKQRLETALARNVPHASLMELNIGNEVLMFREKPVGKWVGPYTVQNIGGKQITLDTGDRTLTASIDKLKLYNQRTEPVQIEPQPDPQTTRTNADLPALESPHNQDLEKLLEPMWDTKRIADGNDGRTDIDELVVKIIESGDPRGEQPDFQDAKRSEVEGLKKRGIWRVVKSSDVPEGANVLGGRFIMCLKNHGTPHEKPKVRYVAQGHKDKDKPYIVHDTSTLRASSIRLILSAAAIHKFRIFSHDVTQAYLQSKDKLSRQIFVRPKPADLETFGIAADELLELVRPIYGLCDAGDYWGLTMNSHLTNDLGMNPLLGDNSVFVMKQNECLEGVTGSYVDDCLHAGNKDFEARTEQSLSEFESKPRVYDNFDFFGAQIYTLQEGYFTICQQHYARNLSLVANDCSFENFRKHRALFSWLGHTRPEMLCYANRAAQVSNQTFGKDKVRELNRGIKLAQQNLKAGLTYKPLDKCSLELRIYADASFSTNDDLSSQLGYLIALCDSENQCHVLDYSSKKSKRIVRSIMGGEVCAFMDAFDAAFMIAKDIIELLGVTIPIVMFTDSKQLFDAITKGKRTTEKRLMIDISSARQSYKRFEIQAVGLIQGIHNPADGLSKINGNDALSRLLRTSMDATPVEQWINRSDVQSTSDITGPAV